MPTPLKPCAGTFTDETVSLLLSNRNREQWQSFPCELCGQQVSPKLEKGKWVPEPHWQSVRYVATRRRAGKSSALPA